MTYLLAADGRDDDAAGAFERYRDHLASSRDSFPRSAYALATSDWYFNVADHRCPHDGWLESLSLTELGIGARAEIRGVSVRIRLLGAYHDGYIELLYPRVFRYRLSVNAGERGHRDWRYDELRLREMVTSSMKSSGMASTKSAPGSSKLRMSSSDGYLFDRCTLAR